ncbi:MAG TPA: hypothetical protein VJL29_06615 [Thermoguttaceae bacterium]|nr:hypothetical protein [Thermoguttaceae bacterium]
MHTVELLDDALGLAGQLGYRTRQVWLDGRGGGGCEIKGQKWIFLDLSLSADEQLDQTLDALRTDPAVAAATMSEELRQLLVMRKSA